MNYRVGLDIGIASVGYSVIETDENGEPCRIEKLGVRIFEKAEQPKTGASLAEPRRLARGVRRVIRRRQHRVERVKWLLSNKFGENIIGDIEKVEKDIYELRYEGLTRELTKAELGKVLLYFVKHRGFLSNRKAESQEKEGGLLLKATEKNRAYLQEKGYRTVGEMIYKDEKYFHYVNGVKEYTTRNKEGIYDNTFLRDDLLEEIKAIMETQKSFGYIDDDFSKKFTEKEGIFYKNRNFDEGPGAPSKYRGGYAVGDCPFISGEKRAPKSAWTVEYNNALQKLNNLKIVKVGEERFLTLEERAKILELIKTKEKITFSNVRKVLNVDEEKGYFNLLNYSNKKELKKTEDKTFVSMARSYAIKKALADSNKSNIDVIDNIALILSNYKSDDNRIIKLKEIKALSNDEINNLLLIHCKEFAGVSIKFLKAIQPFLEKGEKYNEACEHAGYNHSVLHSGERSKKLNTQEIYDQLNEITSPVVKRSVSQTLKVLNAIIDKYGSPIAINVELAREMSKDFKERNKISKDNEERKVENEKVKEELQKEYGILMPSGQDILKLRLYKEQQCKCAYSLKSLDLRRLFEPNYVQIDHVIPYSRSFDDSMNNKVLVLAKENQDKRNRLPYEYFGADEKKWQEFETFVLATYANNRKKTSNLLKKSFTAEDEKNWKEQNLNDTKYISKFVYNLIKDNLQFSESKSKKKVVAVSGKITSYARKLWGLVKCREEGDKHHALDAAVIACITDGDIQKITNFSRNKENFVEDKNIIVDLDGVVIEGKQPYNGFSKELEYRLANDPKYYTDFFIKQGYTDEEINGLEPVFVSRMVDKKAKGVIHDATIRSAKIFEEKGEIITKTSLTALKLGKDGEIENYYRPKDDALLYNKLKDMLTKEPDANKAFKDPVYKPKADGTNGPIVKKVKLVSKMTDGVLLNKINGVAANGSMVRIDVFTKNDKYYCIPVYIKDLYKKELPNKAAVASKPYKEWIEIDETYKFKFSLHKNDLIFVSHKTGISLTKTNSNNKDDKITIKEGFLYYNGFGISTASINCNTHDNGYAIPSLGVQTLRKFQKCSVDIMGNISFVKDEKREDFSNFGNTKKLRENKCRL